MPKLFRLFSDKKSTSDTIDKLFDYYNKELSSNGICQLCLNDKLTIVAQEQAKLMNANKKIIHRGPIYKRLRDLGYHAMVIKENVAHADNEQILNHWANKNNLPLGYKDCGFGVSGKYWCAIFATQIIIRDNKDKLGFQSYIPFEYYSESRL